MNITFIKENKKWYADLPDYIAQGGKKADCEMVHNAPSLIEKMIELKQGNKNKITVNVFPEKPVKYDAELTKTDEINGWGYYDAVLENGESFLDVGLCPVNAYFFGGFQPAVIYVIL